MDGIMNNQQSKEEAEAPNQDAVLIENLEVKTTQHKPALLPQIVITLVSAWCHVNTGFIHGFAAVALPRLQDANSTDIVLTEDQGALFSSIPNLGGVVGALVSSVLVVRLGQRKAVIAFAPVICGAWLTIVFAKTIEVLITARLLLGFCLPSFNLSSHMYVAESVHQSNRGTCAGFIAIFRYAGMLLIYSLGATNLTWRQLSLICGISATVVPFVGFIFLHDSPRWLASKKRFEEAEKSLLFARGASFLVDGELQKIRDELQHEKKSSARKQMKQLRKSSIRTRFLWLALIATILAFSGNLVVTNYAVIIFQMTGSDIDPFLSTVYIGIAKFVSAIVFMLIVDKIHRRLIFMLSFLIAGVSCVLMGTYFYFREEMPDSPWLETFNWLPVTSMVIFIALCGVGYSVDVIIRGEVLPTSFRSFGMSQLMMMFSMNTFVVLLSYPSLVKTFKNYGTFWFFACLCFLVSWLPYAFLPESRGHSLEEIEANHNQKLALLKEKKAKKRVEK